MAMWRSSQELLWLAMGNKGSSQSPNATREERMATTEAATAHLVGPPNHVPKARAVFKS